MNKTTISEWGHEDQLPSCYWNTYLVKKQPPKLEILFDNMDKIIHTMIAGELSWQERMQNFAFYQGDRIIDPVSDVLLEVGTELV